MIISYEPILTKIALPEIPGIKKNENATKPLKNIKGEASWTQKFDFSYNAAVNHMKI